METVCTRNTYSRSRSRQALRWRARSSGMPPRGCSWTIYACMCKIISIYIYIYNTNNNNSSSNNDNEYNYEDKYTYNYNITTPPSASRRRSTPDSRGRESGGFGVRPRPTTCQERAPHVHAKREVPGHLLDAGRFTVRTASARVGRALAGSAHKALCLSYLCVCLFVV